MTMEVNICHDDIDDDEIDGEPEHVLGIDDLHLAQLALLQRHLQPSIFFSQYFYDLKF